jgi:hypothetical protein
MRAIINSDLSEVYAMPIDFSRLQDISAVLNSKSDSINAAIKAFEAKLASLRLGVSAWVSRPLTTQLVDPGTQTEDTLITKIGYSKATGAWCLTLMEDSERWGDDEEHPPRYTPLSQASREMRINAIKYLPSLVKALEKSADEALVEVDQAEQLLRDLSG